MAKSTVTSERVQKQREANESLSKAYERLFSTPDGQVVLAHLARECRVFSALQNPRPDGHYDPLVTSFNDGKRSVALGIFNMLSYEKRDPREVLESLKP